MAEHQQFMAQFVRAERPIRALLLVATGDLDLVDDLMQNVAVALWMKWPEYNPEHPFRAWALGVTRIEVLRWRRSAARNRTVLNMQMIDQLVDAADRAAGKADQRLGLLAQCLDEVQADAREVLNLKYADGMRARQIAEEVGKTVGAVEMIISRTRRALRKCIQRKLAEA